MDPEPEIPNLLLPLGTQVVTRAEVREPDGSLSVPRGSVGVVAEALPGTPVRYQVRFLDGKEAIYPRAALTIRKHFQRQVVTDLHPMEGDALFEYVIFRCIVGSRALGLETDSSDTDRRGFYLPPAELHWSLAGVPEQLENEATQETYWELQKFINLALKANPNVLECLYTPLVEVATPLAEELLSIRHIFLSQLVYQTYSGYVMSQFRKLEQDLRAQGTIKWKHAMHLIRLLLSGITVLREGFVPLELAGQRERLLTVKRGEVPWAEVNSWRLALHREFEEAFRTTSLPEWPDYTQANAFLLRARRSMVAP